MKPRNFSRPSWLLAASLIFFEPLAFAQADRHFQASLVGDWQEIRQVDCEEHRQRIQLRSDGTFTVAGFIGACDRLLAFVWLGRWDVVNRKFVYTSTSSNPPDVYPKGVTFEDEIVNVTDDSWEMIEKSTGNRSLATRIK